MSVGRSRKPGMRWLAGVTRLSTLFVVTGCTNSCDLFEPDVPDPSCASSASVAVSSTRTTIAVGDSEMVTARVIPGRGCDAADPVSWTVISSDVLSHAARGRDTIVVTGLAPGVASVYAFGPIDFKSITFTVVPGDPATLTIAAPYTTLPVGDSVQLTATVRNIDGVVVPASITWTTQSPLVATITQTGRVKALAPGSVTITAASGIARDSLRLTVAAAGACINQPQAWYALNGNGLDASGNNHGTVQGAVSVNNRHGEAQSALAFDGNDDSIELGDRFNTLALPFSIATWVYQPAAARGDLRSIFVTDDEPGRYAGIWLQTTAAGQPEITFADAGGAGSQFRRSLTAQSPMPADSWIHLVATVRDAADMTLYVNGVAVAGSYSGTGGPLTHTAGPARIGRIGILPANRPWLGSLDEVRIYGCSLSATEVTAVFTLR